MNNLFIGNGSGHNEVYLWECVFARVSLEDVLRTKRSTGCWVAGLRSGSAVVGCDRIATVDVGQSEPRVVCVVEGWNSRAGSGIIKVLDLVYFFDLFVRIRKCGWPGRVALDTSIGLKDSMSAAEPLFRDVLEKFHSSCYPRSSL